MGQPSLQTPASAWRLPSPLVSTSRFFGCRHNRQQWPLTALQAVASTVEALNVAPLDYTLPHSSGVWKVLPEVKVEDGLGLWPDVPSSLCLSSSLPRHLVQLTTTWCPRSNDPTTKSNTDFWPEGVWFHLRKLVTLKHTFRYDHSVTSTKVQ